MSKGKYSGLTKKKKEERTERQKSSLEKVVSSIAGQTQRFINEWQEKHNTIAEKFDKVIRTVGNEFGKVWGNQQGIVDSIDHIDLNVLAIAEQNKDIYNRFARIEPLLKTLAEMAEVTDQAVPISGEELYTEACKAAFAAVIERRNKEAEERKVAAEKAVADAQAAAVAKTEAERAEKALKEAESETLSEATSGGKGAEIPEGAQVFGG